MGQNQSGQNFGQGGPPGGTGGDKKDQVSKEWRFVEGHSAWFVLVLAITRAQQHGTLATFAVLTLYAVCNCPPASWTLSVQHLQCINPWPSHTCRFAGG